MKILICTLFIFASFNLYAKSGIALVTGLKGDGQAFLFTPEGKVKTLRVGDFIYDHEQIMIEVGSQLTFKYNNNNSYYHLNGGSQIKFDGHKLSLVRGTLWGQARASEASRSSVLEVESANAFTKYANTDFIFHYDAAKGRSQLLVLHGEAQFGNVLNKKAYLNVLSGNVSQVDKKYQDGLPRVPTMIGMDSFNEVVSSFKGITPTDGKELVDVLSSQDKKSEKSRKIASITQTKITPGKIIFIETKVNRLPASVGPSAMDYYLKTKKIKKKKLPSKKKMVEAPVRIYGHKASQRNIASVKPLEVERTIASEREQLLDDINAAFVMSLNEEASEQKRHSPERLKLIQELESVSQQFQKNY